MKNGFYRRLAFGNIKKNYRFYIPRILCEMGLLACFYIALTLTMDERITQCKGGDYVPSFMVIGSVVLTILSTVLMFYTNSFLMKQRKREFGIYNVLGMEKKHVGKVLFYEGLISDSVAIAGGLILGMLFYKLCSLLVCKLLQSDIILGFYFITLKSILPAAGLFILLDLLTYVFNRISIARMNPVELIASRQTGEQEPKVKWLMLIIGAVSLFSGYYLAVTVKSPIKAITFFFAAVFLVILGTYFLFVTGSTFVLKALKKNEKYYYNKKHMPAVSGLLYRMKQNAVGLASIAILATGVLVMISTTVSLYSGMQESLDRSYPQHLYLSSYYTGNNGNVVHVPAEDLEKMVRDSAEKNGVVVKEVSSNEFLDVSFYVRDNRLYAESEIGEGWDLDDLTTFIFITEDTYSELTGKKLGLSRWEVASCRISSPIGGIRDLEGTLYLGEHSYKIVKTLASFPLSLQMLASVTTCYGIVVPSREKLVEIYRAQKESYGLNASELTKRIAVEFEDRDAASLVGHQIQRDIRDSLESYMESRPDRTGGYRYNMDSYWNSKESVIGMYGTLLFLGILLGTVCLFATVLIIYYKQISEGYEDRERFQIMEKVGMSKKEVKRTINSQVLLVFFLPLIVAGVHMAFAFPMLKRMLNLLMLYKGELFLVCALIAYVVFALVYTLIYARTSKTYYKIVE